MNIRSALLAGAMLAAACAQGPAAMAQAYPAMPGPDGRAFNPPAFYPANPNNGAPCFPGNSGCPGTPTTPGPLVASGVSPVSFAIGSATQSASFTPVAGRPFNISFTGAGVGACQVEEQTDGTNWAQIVVAASGQQVQLGTYALTGSGVPFTDSITLTQYNVPVRLNCASGATGGGWVSGTISGTFSQ